MCPARAGWFDCRVNNEQQKTAVCRLDEIKDPGSRGFDHPKVSMSGAAYFVVHKHGEVFAYVNRCPHTGAPLEWQPDQFLDFDDSFIQCAIHGALFRVKDGYCLRGPCAGASLQRLAVEVIDGVVAVDLAPLSGGLETAPDADAGSSGQA